MTEEELDKYEAYLQNYIDTCYREAEEKKCHAEGYQSALSALRTMREQAKKLKGS